MIALESECLSQHFLRSPSRLIIGAFMYQMVGLSQWSHDCCWFGHRRAGVPTSIFILCKMGPFIMFHLIPNSL